MQSCSREIHTASRKILRMVSISKEERAQQKMSQISTYSEKYINEISLKIM
jgi:hypothetical protein